MNIRNLKKNHARFLALLCPLLLFPAMVTAAQQPLQAAQAENSYKEALSEARKALNEKDFQRALTSAAQAVKLAEKVQDKTGALFLKASILERNGDLASARKAWEQIASMQDAPLRDRINALSWSASSFRKEKDPDSAMKLYERILALPDLPAQNTAEAVSQIARIFEEQKKYPEARAEYAKILDMKDLKSQFAANALSGMARTFQQEKKPELARNEYERILELPEDLQAQLRSNAYMDILRLLEQGKQWTDYESVAEKGMKDNRLTATQQAVFAVRKANALFSQWKFDEAVAVLDKAAGEAGKDMNAKYEVLSGKGNLYSRMSDYPNAASVYSGIASDTAFTPRQRLNAAKNASRAFSMDRNFSAAEALYNKLLSSGAFEKDMLSELYGALADTHAENGQFDKAREVCRKGLAVKEQSAGSESSRKLQLCRISYGEKDMEHLKKDLAEFLPALNPREGALLLADYAAIRFDRGQYQESFDAYQKLDFSQINPDWRRSPHVERYLRLFSLLGKKEDDFRSAAAAMTVENPSFQAPFRMQCAILAEGWNPSEKSVEKAFAPFRDEATAETKMKALSSAGKILVLCGKDDAARELFRIREKLFRDVPRNLLKVRYVENAPGDVGSWLASDIIKHQGNKAVVDRPYGAAEAAFLYTDVMAAGRKVGDPKLQADKETYFYMVCDDQGLKLFFVGIDSRVKDVLNKRLSGSGYEMYIALGEDGPSYQWLFEQPEDKLMIPPWNSPHKFYRHLNDYVTIATQPIENGFATCMNFSWELAYDRLPQNGDTWPFELIRWTRGGGVTWGGKSVWQIGNWGRLQFELTEKQLVQIRRNLVYKALAKFKKEYRASSGGLVAVWQDSELGDPQFYKQELEPLVKQLEQYAELVTEDMPEETVNMLFEKAVPAWMDFQYFVAELRRAYLLKQLTSAEK